MIFKEDFVPGKAHKFLFTLAPILALAPVLIVVRDHPVRPADSAGASCSTRRDDRDRASQPIGAADRAARRRPDLLLRDLSLAVYGATLAGWASHNKWALLGGLRASSQMMSYEVAMGLAVLGAFLVYGTLEPGAIVAQQTQHLQLRHSARAGASSRSRSASSCSSPRRSPRPSATPFDIPEGEPEIIGYFVEYSGMRFGMFFLAEFIEIVFLRAIMITVFFGGWQVPFLYDRRLRSLARTCRTSPFVLAMFDALGA